MVSFYFSYKGLHYTFRFRFASRREERWFTSYALQTTIFREFSFYLLELSSILQLPPASWTFCMLQRNESFYSLIETIPILSSVFVANWNLTFSILSRGYEIVGNKIVNLDTKTQDHVASCLTAPSISMKREFAVVNPPRSCFLSPNSEETAMLLGRFGKYHLFCCGVKNLSVTYTSRR